MIIIMISFKQEENIQNEEERKILLFKIKQNFYFQKINKMKKITNKLNKIKISNNNFYNNIEE